MRSSLSSNDSATARRRRVPRVLLVILLAQRSVQVTAWQASLLSSPHPHQLAVKHSVLVPPSAKRPLGCRRGIRILYPTSTSSTCLAAASAASSASEESDAVPSDTDSSTDATESAAPPQKINYQWTKQNLAIALPALIGMLADPLLSLMDTAYVGRVGSIELAALGACTSIFHLAFNAFRATTAATTSLVATSLAEDPEEARQVTLVSLQLGLWMGVFVTGTLLVTGKIALAGMGVDVNSPLYKPASEYLFTRCWAAPVVLLMGVAEGAFRGYGNTIVPALASITAALMNLVLDPLLIFNPVQWGVRGAAAATAISQVGAVLVYGWNIVKRKMLPQRRYSSLSSSVSAATTTSASPSAAAVQQATATTIAATTSASAAEVTAASTNSDSPTDATTLQKKKKSRWVIIRTILAANLAMLTKQGSLLLAWAVATARATRMGAEHVAAHQVALSVWLVFALILDGTAVSAQVLSSRAYASRDRAAVKSLTKYMVQFAVLQGLVSMLVVDGLALWIPGVFTPDPIIQGHLLKLMPCLAWQQVLVSLTLVVESLAVGANQFQTLALGTTAATVVSIWQLFQQTSVEGIWNSGIVTLFAGRLATGIYACARAQYKLRRQVDLDEATAASAEDAGEGGMAVA
jgi:Na+-driven multidrug efflux pump